MSVLPEKIEQILASRASPEYTLRLKKARKPERSGAMPMSEWYISRNGTQHGPVTAKKLKELADAGQLQPTDQVCANGVSVAAGKVAGLIYDVAGGEAVVNIYWQGAGGLVDMSVAVRFDGDLLGNGSLINGFRFTVPTTIGRHTLGVKLSFPLKREKQYALDVQQMSVYNAVLSYNLFWGNFAGECNFGVDGQVVHAEACVQQQWDAEREIARCPSCGAEWVAEFLGEKVVQTANDFESRWVTETTHTAHENINYGGLRPDSDWMRDYRRELHSESQTQRQIMVPVQIQTCHLFFQCSACGKKWKKQFERKIDK